jgi:6-phosphogluconate dehydrogenase (decarboxylating)
MQIGVVGLGRMSVAEKVLSAMRFGSGGHVEPGKR